MKKENICESCERYRHCIERSREMACKDYKKNEKGEKAEEK